MDLDEAILTCEDSMEKTLEFLKQELRGLRTGRATPALVEFIKVDYYDTPTDLRQLALITVPEPTQILVKPYDASCIQQVVKSIQASGLGLNPSPEGKQIRLVLPPLSGERRQQLVGQVKQIGEQTKIAIRNARRDANKHADQAKKDKTLHLSEDSIEQAKHDTQELLKKFEKQVDDAIATKSKEVLEI